MHLCVLAPCHDGKKVSNIKLFICHDSHELTIVYKICIQSGPSRLAYQDRSSMKYWHMRVLKQGHVSLVQVPQHICKGIAHPTEAQGCMQVKVNRAPAEFDLAQHWRPEPAQKPHLLPAQSDQICAKPLCGNMHHQQ